MKGSQPSPTEIYRSYIDAENRRDRVQMELALHPALQVAINGVEQLASRNADAEATDQLLATYPDYQRHLHRVLQVGRTVVAEWEMSGTGDPAKSVPDLAVRGCTVADIENGVIVKASLYTDPKALDSVFPD